ncbi:MAG: alanine racemase [Candidatus Vogelbacteria bacterium]|nr:alanine racemase [Candidatus Vogelbacteria bacterium]
MTRIENSHLRTWIEVDTPAVAHNYRRFRQFLGSRVKLMAVVKSNGYGHGLVPFAKLLSALGTDWLGVDSMVEARRLREEGIKLPILVLGYTRPAFYREAARLGVALTISSGESLIQLLTSNFQPLIHLKVDTGMHRQGFLFADFKKLLPKFKLLKLQGIYSHLAASDGKSRAATQAQIKEFGKFLVLISKQHLIKHLAATGGAIACPEARFDLVRIGLGLYGLWPNKSLRRRFGSKINLRPALTWRTVISEIKILPAGGRVGYDLTERVKPGTKLAVCPVGYWHGYPRALSGSGRVLIKNQWAKVIGRVSMDMIVIDVTKVKNLQVGEEVTLLGGRSGPPAEDLARLAQTSNYEIITRLNPLIERFYC